MIEKGMLPSKGSAYTVRKLSIHDLPTILHLQESVVHQLTNKDTLQSLSSEEYQYILNGNGFIIGVFMEDKLIALRALLDPPLNEEHLGYSLGLEAALDEIIYQEISIVDPVYRGNRLQQKLADIIMKELEKSNHHYSYVCATVAPHNIPSLKDKFYQGMEIGALITIYQGKLRFVFVKKIHSTTSEKDKVCKSVAYNDVEYQKDLLNNGWRGKEITKKGDMYYIWYAR